MDDIDRASEREQELTREALSKRMPEGPKITGLCHQCGAELYVNWMMSGGVLKPDGRRWCDSQCRDDWEKANG